jgi:hypothetical protein
MQMTIRWNSRIPKIGEKLKLPDSNWYFLVEGYGEQRPEVIELKGCLKLDTIMHTITLQPEVWQLRVK